MMVVTASASKAASVISRHIPMLVHRYGRLRTPPATARSGDAEPADTESTSRELMTPSLGRASQGPPGRASQGPPGRTAPGGPGEYTDRERHEGDPRREE